jgi:hypothetical protein
VPVLVPGHHFHQINEVSQYNKPVALGGNYPFNHGTNTMHHNGMQKNGAAGQGTRNRNNNSNIVTGY